MFLVMVEIQYMREVTKLVNKNTSKILQNDKFI